MKMLIFRLCVILLNSRAFSAECLLKHGFGLSEDDESILDDVQPKGPSNIDSCKTSCDNAVKALLFYEKKLIF